MLHFLKNVLIRNLWCFNTNRAQKTQDAGVHICEHGIVLSISLTLFEADQCEQHDSDQHSATVLALGHGIFHGFFSAIFFITSYKSQAEHIPLVKVGE